MEVSLIKLYSIVNEGSKTPYFEVLIRADENDGDYRTETRKYSVEEFNNKASYLLYLLKVWEYYGEGDLEDFPYYYEAGIPSSTNNACHTIVEKNIFYYDNEGKKSIVKLDAIENDFYHKEDEEFYDFSNIEKFMTDELYDMYKVLYAIYKVSGEDIKCWHSCLQFDLPSDSEWEIMMIYFKKLK